MRKHTHPISPLNDIDPLFYSPYVEAINGEKLCKEFDLSHMDVSLCNKVYCLIQKYLLIFYNKGQFIPVKDYSCKIDTSFAKPVSVKKIHYGPRKIPIICKCIASLTKLGHIRCIYGGKWLLKALLTLKLHQEHVSNIGDLVWQFCWVR